MAPTVAEHVAAARALPAPAPDRDRRRPGGIWGAEYEEYSAMSDELRARTEHVLDLRYGDDPRHIVDVYLPERSEGPAPVLVFFHGGALEEGHPRRYGFVGAPYLARGAIFVSAGYRVMSPELAARRGAVEERISGLVHAVRGAADPEVAAVRRDVAQLGADAAEDGRRAIAWVHRNIADFGGDPDRITIAGHSSGAMIAVAAACADDWQRTHGVPDDTVKAMVPVGGRYGLWLANAIVSGGDIEDPDQVWRLGRAPRSVVVFGEEEYDGIEVEVPERARDCALIGRSLVRALRERGAEVTEMALSPRGHWQTLRSLADESDRTVPAVLEAMGIETTGIETKGARR